MSEPVLVGLLFADKIIIENNGKRGIIGTFNRFYSKKFPIAFPPWAIYAAVTNLEGKHEFALTLVREETNQVIMPLNGQFDVRGRNDVVELTPAILGVVFPQPGTYILTFSVDGIQLGARVLFVDQVKEGQGKK
jgi:hypothetical protein